MLILEIVEDSKVRHVVETFLIRFHLGLINMISFHAVCKYGEKQLLTKIR